MFNRLSAIAAKIGGNCRAARAARIRLKAACSPSLSSWTQYEYIEECAAGR